MDDQWLKMKNALMTGEYPDAPNELFGILVDMLSKLSKDEACTASIKSYLNDLECCPHPDTMVNWLRKEWSNDVIVGTMVTLSLKKWKEDMLTLIKESTAKEKEAEMDT